MKMKPSEETVRLFEKDRFATDNGAVIEDVSDHYAKCVLKVEDRHRNAMGAVMGGVYFTLADFAFAVAANGHSTRVTVTQQVSITFLSASRGKILTAEARCLKAGRTTCLYAVDITDDLGAQVAHLTVNGYTITPKAPKET